MEPMLSQCSANATVKVQFVIRTQLIICLYMNFILVTQCDKNL